MYLSTPLTHLQNGNPIFYKMVLFSYKVMLGVYKQYPYYKMEAPDGKKKT